MLYKVVLETKPDPRGITSILTIGNTCDPPQAKTVQSLIYIYLIYCSITLKSLLSRLIHETFSLKHCCQKIYLDTELPW